MEDWEKNPEKYLTNSDGSYILKKDGTPKKKSGRPKNTELSDIKLAIQAKNKLNKKNQKVKKLTRNLARVQKELKEELLLNFDVEKIDSTLDKWLNLGKTKSINDLLLENGHAYEYEGGKKKVFGG